jgi:hypothetical protein
VEQRHRSRREELSELRADLTGRGAPLRHIAHVIQVRFNVNSRTAFRLAHGLTQQQVAEEWNRLWPTRSGEPTVTHKNISYWEAWPAPTGREPSPSVLNRLARIYRCRAADLLDGEDHSGEADDGRPSVEAPRASARGTLEKVHAEPSDVLIRVDAFIAESGSFLVSREADYQQLTRELIEWACRMKRRDILQWLSWAAGAAAAAPVLDGLNTEERQRVALTLQSPHRVDDTVVDHIEAVLWRCRRQYDALGSWAVLDTVLAQRNLLRFLIPEAPHDHVKTRLLSLYANISQFAGWLLFDLSNYDAAADYYEKARTAAHEAHDIEFGVLVLCSMSYLASWRGQPRVGIDHAVAAQGWARQVDNPRLTANAYAMGARVLAMDGQARAALSGIEQAHTVLAKADVAGPRTVAYPYNDGILAIDESVCHLHLGDAKTAAEVAGRATGSFGDTFTGNQTVASLQLAVSRLRADKPDVVAAAMAIREAGRSVSRNRSTRLAERLRRGLRQLEPWRDTPEVKDVREELAALGLN